MLQVYKDLDLDIPEGVEVKLHARTVTIKGPRGELTKVSVHGHGGFDEGDAAQSSRSARITDAGVRRPKLVREDVK